MTDDIETVELDPLTGVVLEAVIAWLDERHDPRLVRHADGRVTIHDAATVFRDYAGVLTEAVDWASRN